MSREIEIRIPADEADRTAWYYIVSQEAWYANAIRLGTGRDEPEIFVSRSSTEGGCFWEFPIRQVSNIGIRAEIFSDAWAAFVERPDLFRGLSELGRDATLGDVRDILDDLGFTDETQREAPAGYRDPNPGRPLPPPNDASRGYFVKGDRWWWVDEAPAEWTRLSDATVEPIGRG